MPHSTIPENAVHDFEEHGVTLLRGVLNDWVEPLRSGVERNMADPGPFVRDYRDDLGGRFFGDFCNWQRIPEYREFLFDSPAADIAGALMQTRSVRLFHEHVLVKEPATEIPTPWHHDQPYYCVDGVMNCSIWLPLDPVPKKRGLEFIAGSHRWQRWFRPERFDRTPLFENDTQEPMPDIEGHRDRYDIRCWDLEPGDVVAFHYLTLHGAPANRSGSRRRRAFSSRWVGDDATFAIRSGRTSPPFPDCRLRHGDPLEGDEFPLVRQFT
jgi:ectoine hydroxylase-related dioxygenase (phytanoyl-CoA dioxygenase family)